MSSDKRECVFVHALWEWIDQQMNQSDMRNEEIKELGLAGGTLALEEAGFRRALHAFMNDVLDDESDYIYDLNKEKEEEEKFIREHGSFFDTNSPIINPELNTGNSVISDGKGGTYPFDTRVATEKELLDARDRVFEKFGLTDKSFKDAEFEPPKRELDKDDDIPF